MSFAETHLISPSVNNDFMLASAMGLISGVSTVNKFGHNTNVDQNVDTDIWDLSTQPIWLAPTAPRIHTIASDNIADTTGSTGANSVIINYLPDWDTAEATETVTGNLNGGIAMTNASVIIHRMQVVPQASSTSANVGTITATAATDGTVTAQINPGIGQTEMAIYGIPSTQTFYMTKFYYSVLRSAGATAAVDADLVFNPSPDVNPVVFLHKHTTARSVAGTSNGPSDYKPYNPFAGPGILKLQATGTANDLNVSGGFDGILIDN